MDSKILLITAFADIMVSSNNRCRVIFDYLKADKQIITTDFCHSKKTYYPSIELKNKDYKFIHVPAYSRNLSIKRIFSHVVFAYRLWKYLTSIEKKISVLYCAMPTSTAAYVCGRYCKKNKVKFVIDVIDLWPNSLFPLTSYQRLLSIITYPWKWITIQAYKMADVIIGESVKYANEAAIYNKKAPVYPFYLGVDLDQVEELLLKSTIELIKPENEIWIVYGGSLGTSYDFETLVKSISILNGKYKYKLLFVGDGVARKSVEKLISKFQVNAEITGFVSYSDYLKYLSYCDIAVNIFKENTKVVHSYKFNDYVATNCFILNSLTGETADMVEKYKNGLNFGFKLNKLDEVIIECLDNWNIYKHWKLNNEKLVKEVLDKKMIYSKINQILTN